MSQFAKIGCSLLLGMTLSLAGCQRAAAPAPTPATAPAQPTWSAFVDEFVAAYFKANPAFAVGQGRHEYDGVFPDWSAAGIAKTIAELHAFRDRAAAYADGALDVEQRFERDYLLARIDNDLFWLEQARTPFTNPAFYLNDALDPSVYVTRPYASIDVRAAAFIKYAEGVAAAAPVIRANLPEVLPTTFVKLGVAGFGGLADFYRKDVPQAFAGVRDPQLKQRLAAAIEPAAQAMQGLAAHLAANESRAIAPQPLGAEKFSLMLRMTERVDLPIEVIERAGREDLERNLADLRKACARYAPGASIEACNDRVYRDKPAGGAVAGASAQLAGLRKFIVDHDVVTIPGPEVAEVDEAPPFNRQNFAFIQIPGPYEKNLPSVYYIAPPDPSWPKAEQSSYVPGKQMLLFTSAHEVWPGHFLQFLHANRAKSQIGKLFVGYAYAEGWAHYAEELMLEKGLGGGDPAAQIGQINEALLRNVRLMCAIGMHTRGMSLAECERMFREQGLQSPGSARQQAARGTYDPAYLNYTLGKLMIRKLRADWAATRGGEKAWKAFHDEFLSFGGPPIPLVRARMLGPNAGAAL